MKKETIKLVYIFILLLFMCCNNKKSNKMKVDSKTFALIRSDSTYFELHVSLKHGFKYPRTGVQKYRKGQNESNLISRKKILAISDNKFLEKKAVIAYLKDNNINDRFLSVKKIGPYNYNFIEDEEINYKLFKENVKDRRLMIQGKRNSFLLHGLYSTGNPSLRDSILIIKSIPNVKNYIKMNNLKDEPKVDNTTRTYQIIANNYSYIEYHINSDTEYLCMRPHKDVLIKPMNIDTKKEIFKLAIKNPKGEKKMVLNYLKKQNIGFDSSLLFKVLGPFNYKGSDDNLYNEMSFKYIANLRFKKIYSYTDIDSFEEFEMEVVE